MGLGYHWIVLSAESVLVTIETTEQQEQAYGVPLFFVLNNLHSSDIMLSRLALDWMRCDLGLYVK